MYYKKHTALARRLLCSEKRQAASCIYPLFLSNIIVHFSTAVVYYIFYKSGNRRQHAAPFNLLHTIANLHSNFFCLPPHIIWITPSMKFASLIGWPDGRVLFRMLLWFACVLHSFSFSFYFLISVFRLIPPILCIRVSRSRRYIIYYNLRCPTHHYICLDIGS